MGRIRKYKTKKDRKIAQNKRAMAYYERNKESIRKKNLERYYLKKKENNDDNLQDNKSH
jgi:hypothetical protein